MNARLEARIEVASVQRGSLGSEAAGFRME
jgi:hypothetical protein